jgi:hypothetical protein
VAVEKLLQIYSYCFGSKADGERQSHETGGASTTYRRLSLALLDRSYFRLVDKLRNRSIAYAVDDLVNDL